MNVQTTSSNNAFRFFGAALDALDTEESVNMKRSYIESISSGLPAEGDLKDPYALFREVMGAAIDKAGHQKLGRFNIESWLSPKPRVNDLELVQLGSYNQFLKNDGFFVFSTLLKDFVKAHVFPNMPGMIGVDHSLTGGVLMALSERFGSKNLGVVVFDVHTDAIPLRLRSGLVQYASERKSLAHGPVPLDLSDMDDPYTAGNFLLQLIDRDVILPENLVIIGPRDSAHKFKNSADQRVTDYVNHYESLCRQGVTIITGEQLEQSGPTDVENQLNEISCPQLYVSLDVDVSALCGILAARFTDVAGTEILLILKAASAIADLISSNKFSLAGIDVMEVDIYKIGATLSSGVEDHTTEFLQQYVSLFL